MELGLLFTCWCALHLLIRDPFLLASEDSFNLSRCLCLLFSVSFHHQCLMTSGSAQAFEVLSFILSLCPVTAISPLALLSFSMDVWCVLICVWIEMKRVWEKLLRLAVFSLSLYFFFYSNDVNDILKGGSNYRKLTPTAITWKYQLTKAIRMKCWVQKNRPVEFYFTFKIIPFIQCNC